ncbi:MFS transporter [Haematobacter massiliensis]|uniref:MFS transporter n=1 Tax=Haematobacter massiliensis TaxID=195105 RepID=A0A086XT21_9RHOB|nr:MFS transporter [Haematobacter massiliensis]KFI25171.1 MFS transporter [Haematobacter massiliensis]OWJ69838.1 MFS transporter [Haematobacter massiliensis]OWJ88351.1 MFS transporter [Haematobacter massiliensis]
MATTVDAILSETGVGSFQKRLFGIFGLVWAADAMQVLSIGFSAPSIAASFGLTVPQALQTGTLFFLGMFIGAAMFGRIADRIGRRKVLIVTVACDAVFGLASVFAPNFELLLIARFLTGMAVGGTLPVDYAMMAEFLPPKNRGRWLVYLEGFWAVGTVIVALTAWIASSFGVAEAWRWIFAIAAIPALIGFWLRLWVPESPLYLLRTGQQEEVRDVLNRVRAGNGAAPLPRDITITLPGGTEGGSIFSPALRSRTIGVLLLWFLVSISYYGVFTWIPAQLATGGFGFVRGYGFLVLVALAQLPGYALAAYGVEAWGRKPTLILFLLLSALGCLLFTVAGTSALVASSLLLMSFALLGTWGALYAFTPELYPTSVRATGMGAAGAMARLGGICAPTVVGLVISYSFGVTVGLFAALLVLGAVAALTINVETRNQALN